MISISIIISGLKIGLEINIYFQISCTYQSLYCHSHTLTIWTHCLLLDSQLNWSLFINLTISYLVSVHYHLNIQFFYQFDWYLFQIKQDYINLDFIWLQIFWWIIKNWKFTLNYGHIVDDRHSLLLSCLLYYFFFLLSINKHAPKKV